VSWTGWERLYPLDEPHFLACSDVPGRPDMLSRIYGNWNMDLLDLVKALLSYDALTARQWIADAERSGMTWSKVPAPLDLDPTSSALAAGVTEILAPRAGQSPPAWTAKVPPAPPRVFLVRAAETMPRLRELCEREGPELLRRRLLPGWLHSWQSMYW
jgi:hypothetical protein